MKTHPFLFLCILFLGFGGLVACTSIKSPDKQNTPPVSVWMQEGLPIEVCQKNPELLKYGVFRVVECVTDSDPLCSAETKTYEEFVSYCSDRITNYLVIYDDELFELLKQRAKNSN